MVTSIQWRSQEFLSIEQFQSQTIWRIGQPWANEKSTGLQFFKTYYLFRSRYLLKRKVNNPQKTEKPIRCPCITSQRYFFKFEVSYYLLCENYHNHIFLMSNVGRYLTLKPSRCKTVFVTDIKGFPRPFFLEPKMIMNYTLVFDQRAGYNRFIEEDGWP